MTDPDTPTTDAPKPAPPSPLAGLFTQSNITTGLALAAVILAAAPYVVPQIGAWQVRNGLMNRPAMLQDAVQKLQADRTKDTAANATAAIKAHRDAIFNDKDDPVVGKGPIKLIEFTDYLCAACRATAPAVADFLAANPDVQLVVKEYPVVHPPESIALAHLGIAAFRSGLYDAVHYPFLSGKLNNDDDFDSLLKQRGDDPAKVRAVANSPAVSDQVARTINLAPELGVNATPTFIVGDKMIMGADIPAITAAVAAQRKAG